MSTVLPAPRLTDPRDAPILRWGVLAPGGIANDFVDSLVRHTDQRVVAAGSRTLERAEEFARRHGIDRAYGSYAELVADPEVDVVYVSSPHSLHEEHALLAIGAGKHVLVEKPIAPTAAAARRIVAAARAAGVFAMEAMWTRYRPQSDVVRQAIEGGLLGDIQLVTADFGGLAPFDPASRIYDPRLAGGALLDLGVYVAAWATFILGDDLEVTARGRLAPTGVDAHAALVLSSPRDAHALVSASVDARTPVRSVIAGDRGRLEVSSPFWDGDRIAFYDADGTLAAEWTDTFDRPVRQSLCYQAAALARYVDAGLTESPLHGLDETVRVMEILDEARRQIGGIEPSESA
jgi:predicted dehydrogenase